MRPSSGWVVAVTLVAALFAGGCAPSCEDACRKVVNCDVNPGMSQDECVASCNAQEEQYELSGDTDAEQVFQEHRRCIGQASCDELADGVCYDPELFPF